MKRKIIVLATVLIPATFASAFSGSGMGTETYPYMITTLRQLQEIQEDPNVCYALGNDIDASETKSWNDGAGFLPIKVFRGSFNGNGHVINKLYINRPDSTAVGLFGHIYGRSIVKNTGLTDALIFGDFFVGALAGHCTSNCLIDSCWVTGKVTISAAGSKDTKSGGLVGSVSSSVVYRCYSDVSVKALSPRKQIGGLCGYLRARKDRQKAIIEYCSSGGTVTCDGYKVGGLLGDADGPNALVSKCYSVTKVVGSNKKGLVGFNYKSPTISQSYWDKQASDCSTSRGGYGKTTAEMVQQATFVDWNFKDTWAIDEGNSYPYLKPVK